MGEYAVPLLVAAAVFGLTYLFCLRPMRHHAGDASSGCCAPSRGNDNTDGEIAALSREIEALRRSMADPAEAGPSQATDQADIPS